MFSTTAELGVGFRAGRKKEKIHLVSLLSFEGKEKDDEEYAEAEPRRIDAADPDTDDEENPKRHTRDAEEDERRQGEREEEERLWGDFVRAIFLGLRLPKRKRLDRKKPDAQPSCA